MSDILPATTPKLWNKEHSHALNTTARRLLSMFEDTRWRVRVWTGQHGRMVWVCSVQCSRQGTLAGVGLRASGLCHGRALVLGSDATVARKNSPISSMQFIPVFW